jgi:formylglycine-generating enzyme required for sulfatase activity
VRAALAAHAQPAAWEDLDPARPGARLRDPRTGIVFRRVPRGAFWMGSDAADALKPRHRVELSRDYLLAETEVTAAQWDRFVGEHGGPATAPAARHSPQHPRTHLVVAEIEAYCACYGYRLPTEAEWERACRAGIDGEAGPWRSDDELLAHAWFHTNAGASAQPVATRAANAFGLYDMLGNVWEVCSDWYVPGYAGAAAGRTDPHGPSAGLGRVLRGGSWFTLPAPDPAMRSVEELDPELARNGFTGFRPARSLD